MFSFIFNSAFLFCFFRGSEGAVHRFTKRGEASSEAVRRGQRLRRRWPQGFSHTHTNTHTVRQPYVMNAVWDICLRAKVKCVSARRMTPNIHHPHGEELLGQLASDWSARWHTFLHKGRSSSGLWQCGLRMNEFIEYWLSQREMCIGRHLLHWRAKLKWQEQKQRIHV